MIIPKNINNNQNNITNFKNNGFLEIKTTPSVTRNLI
jgi:hypothetical protein